MMKAFFSHSRNPYFNLATEEYFLKHSDQNIFFLYINDPSVIIGKHQNAIAEVDLSYLEGNQIILARRISGGGAVYHDHGNINYSFITNEKPGNYIRFGTYTQPVISALAVHGLEAKLGKRNELLLGDKKISGTASHVYKNRVIHHGTLLFDTRLDVLSKCLYTVRENLSSKAVKSVRSEVMNLKSLLPDISTKEFALSLYDYISHHYYSSVGLFLNDTDKEAVDQLVREKFELWDWNYGYSPNFIVSGEYMGVFIRTEVIKGMISSLTVHEADNPNIQDESLKVRQLENRLQGLVGGRHDKNELIRQLVILGLDPKIADGLF